MRRGRSLYIYKAFAFLTYEFISRKLTTQLKGPLTFRYLISRRSFATFNGRAPGFCETRTAAAAAAQAHTEPRIRVHSRRTVSHYTKLLYDLFLSLLNPWYRETS